MNTLGPLNTAGLLVLGVAVLWTVRLVYGVRGAPGEDLMRRLLLVTGWMLVITGALGVLAGLLSWLSLGFWLLALIVVLMTLARYQDCERRSLLWTLAIAAEKQIPLADAVRSLADERPWSLSGRVTRLAEQLEQGVPLPKALHESRNPLPMDAALAVRFGAETGQMGPALRQVLQHVDLVEMTVRTAIEKLLYMIFVTLSSLTLLVFYAVYVVPRFQALMGGFNVAPPDLTALVFNVCDYLAWWWPVLIPVFVLLPLLALVSLLYYVGWLNHNLPLLGWIWLRYDSGLLLRCLALAVGQRRSISATLGMLAVRFPRASTRRRLRSAVRRIDDGQDWCHALLRADLLTRYDAAVLKSAEGAGNLEWALEEMADSNLRRVSLRMRAWMNWFMPPLFLVFGLSVGLLAVGMFIPLLQMIQVIT